MKKLQFTTKACAFASVLLVAVIFCGCEIPKEKNKTQERIREDDFYTYTYDSCEYVGTKMYWNSAVLVHKGNCKFCAERSKK
jgi:hypothetical protein